MMQEASKRRCNKIKFISLSFVSKLFSQKILIKNVINCDILGVKEIGQIMTFRMKQVFQ